MARRRKKRNVTDFEFAETPHMDVDDETEEGTPPAKEAPPHQPTDIAYSTKTYP